MAIRIRNIKDRVVALCAALSHPKEGDIYLDDSDHHALTTKFGIDFASEGILKDACADEELIPIIEEEQGGRL